MSNFGAWQFDFSAPLVIALALLLLVSLLLSFHSVAQRLYHRAAVRAVAVMALNILAYGIVLLLVLEPRFSRQLEQTVTLVTEGADVTTISTASTASLYVAPGIAVSAEERQRLNGANWLLDIGQVQLRETALSVIDVLGYGLEKDQWLSFSNNIQVNFKPPAINGFTSMQWSRSLLEGEALLVSGHYQSADGDAIVQLRLLDPADKPVDEARIMSGQRFSLSTDIRSRGNLEYTLQAWDSKHQLSEQIVALEARTHIPLNIMIKQSAPSFETRALKDHATATGHRIRLDTDISKGKSISQSANLPADTDLRYSPQILSEQDVLIMDGRALSNLSPTHRQWLSDATDNGLGLLVLADSALLESINDLNTNLLEGFHLEPLPAGETRVRPRLLKRKARQWQEPLTVAAIELSGDRVDVLVDDGYGRSLVIKRQKGLGHIGISLIGHSHNWLTAGQQALWGDYWTPLLASLARQRDGSYLLPQAEPEFHRVGQRTAVCAFTPLEGSGITIRALESQDEQSQFDLSLAADRLNSPRQCAYFWPQVSGWHQVQLFSSELNSIIDEKAFYVFQPEQWLAQQRSQRVLATSARANSKFPVQIKEAKQVYEPLNLLWLWFALIVSASLLWLERKLDFA